MNDLEVVAAGAIGLALYVLLAVELGRALGAWILDALQDDDVVDDRGRGSDGIRTADGRGKLDVVAYTEAETGSDGVWIDSRRPNERSAHSIRYVPRLLTDA